jgi:Primase C terminal 2 (PriCT-2)
MKILRPDLTSIPDELTSRKRWLLWKFEQRKNRKGEPKLTKVPRNPGNLSTEWKSPALWWTFEDVAAKYESGKFHGIGFILGDGIAGVDFDKVMKDGKPLDWARDAANSLNTFTEFSPSGQGLHAYAFGELPPGRRADHSRGVEIYQAGRWFAVTGRRVRHLPARVENRPNQLLEIYRKFLVPDERETRSLVLPAGCEFSPSDDRAIALEALDHVSASRVEDYSDWLAVGMALHSVDPSLSMLAEWDRWSSQSQKHATGECGRKWSSFSENPIGVGIGSLIEWARQNDGWKPPPQRIVQVADYSENTFADFASNAEIEGSGAEGHVGAAKSPPEQTPGKNGKLRECISNYTEIAKSSGDGTVRVPVSMPAIAEKVIRVAEGNPRRVGQNLFVHDRGEKVDWLKSPPALFGWLGTVCGQPADFTSKDGFHSKGEVFNELQRAAECFSSVETLPHEPPLPDHYYAHDEIPAGDGRHLAWLIDRFSPATVIDGDLLRAAAVTLFWGGPGGCRPAFVLTGEGRGSGKTKTATILAELAGGFLDISSNDEITVIKQRLLSDSGRTQRVALLDNVKSFRFSWAELEALLTSPAVSGKQMYVGDASRPNTITWFITLNGVALSTDLAQRSVVIKLAKPQFSPQWEETTRAYVREHRKEIIGDIVAFLQSDRWPLESCTRWGAWERDVLSRLPDPGETQRVIAERQGDSDVEAEEAEILEEYFSDQLFRLGYFPDSQNVFIPARIVATWYNRAMNDHAKMPTVGRIIKQLVTEGKVHRLRVFRSNSERGYEWFGPNSINAEAYRDLEKRIAEAASKRGSSEYGSVDFD